MNETSGSDNISTKLRRVAELARKTPRMVLTTLAHHIDVEFLREAHRRCRKDGSVGVDGQTAADYAEHLEDNLRSLLDRLKSGSYRAPPVRRVNIPKGDGSKTRPIGIPTFEDKILQRAVAMVLEAVYEVDFCPFSYGFRPGRSAHHALRDLRAELTEMGGGWVVDVDIRGFFDNLAHSHLRSFLDQRIRDGVIRRAIDKWLKAGVMEAGQLHRPDRGSPQGGVISPLLANVYLHEVFDTWFSEMVRPVMRGRSAVVRYADDIVMVFQHESDARRVMDVLPKRFGKYGLSLHPEKTRLVEFVRPLPWSKPPAGGSVPRGTFDFLGFTHYWKRTRKGGWAAHRKTARSRLSRTLKAINVWCRRHRHLKVAVQHAMLHRKLVGHYAYFGVSGNYRCLNTVYQCTQRLWQKWLNRRSQGNHLPWARFKRLLERYELPRPRIYHPAGRA